MQPPVSPEGLEPLPFDGTPDGLIDYANRLLRSACTVEQLPLATVEQVARLMSFESGTVKPDRLELAEAALSAYGLTLTDSGHTKRSLDVRFDPDWQRDKPVSMFKPIKLVDLSELATRGNELRADGFDSPRLLAFLGSLQPTADLTDALTESDQPRLQDDRKSTPDPGSYAHIDLSNNLELTKEGLESLIVGVGCLVNRFGEESDFLAVIAKNHKEKFECARVGTGPRQAVIYSLRGVVETLIKLGYSVRYERPPQSSTNAA